MSAVSRQFDVAEWFGRLPTPARLLLILATVVTLVAVNRSSLQASRLIRAENALVQSAELLYVPNTKVVSIISLGYDQVAADALWLRTLSYFAQHFGADRKYTWLEHFLEQIIHFDPQFKRVYHWAGANVLYGRKFINDNVLLSNRFYELALEQFPDDYEAAYRLGLNYYVELKTDDPQQRDAWRQRGLGYLEMAANMPKSPKMVRMLVAGVSRELGRVQLAQQYLIDQYMQTTDPEKRESLQARIAQLGQTDGGLLAIAAADFERNWRAQFDYVPPTYFSLMGEPSSPQQPDVDWRSLSPDVNVDDGGERP